MKLTLLDPEWLYRASAVGHARTQNAAEAQGVLFDCPMEGCKHRIIVWFANPITGSPAPPECWPTPRWDRSGDSFDNLSITPSVNVIGDWHGWVTNGHAL